MYRFLHHCVLVYVLGFSPLLLLSSILFKKRHAHVVLTWKKPIMVIPTIVTFTLNLTLFIVSIFFFASYLGRIDGIRLVEMPIEVMSLLSIDGLLLIGGITMTYFALQNFFTQYVTTNGIVIQKFNWLKFSIEEDLLTWEQINDYYTRSDYPVSIFTFLTTRSGELERIKLSVPFYALPRFEQQLESQMDFVNLQREQLREISNKLKNEF